MRAHTSLALSLILVSGASAGIVEEVVVPPDAHVVSLFSDDPNNDNTDFSANFIQLDATLADSTPQDFLVWVDASSGVSEYDLWVAPANQSGMSWTGLAFALGFGTGSEFEAAHLPGLDFDTDSDPQEHVDSDFSSRGYPPAVHTDTFLLWNQFPTASGNEFLYAFSIDVPDPDATHIRESQRTDSGYIFTLRLAPQVPEPATAGLAAFLGPALLRRGRGRR
jgi:hypothetical protein